MCFLVRLVVREECESCCTGYVTEEHEGPKALPCVLFLSCGICPAGYRTRRFEALVRPTQILGAAASV